MILRWAWIAGVACLAAGCAKEDPGTVLGYGGGPLLSPAVAGEGASAGEADLTHQTLAGKVLSAIALERVTGRKPDPVRFNEHD